MQVQHLYHASLVDYLTRVGINLWWNEARNWKIGGEFLSCSQME